MAAERHTEHVEKMVRKLLSNDKSLNTVSLAMSGVTDEDMQRLAEGLIHNTAADQLNLTSNKIGPDGAEHLAAALTKNQNLRRLYLGQNNLGSDGIWHLASALKKASNINVLELNQNNIGPPGAKALAEVLEVSQSLTALHLGLNKFGPTGAAALAGALEKNHSIPLNSLDLSRNSMGPDGLKLLIPSLLRLRSLKYLVLNHNGMNDDNVHMLADLAIQQMFIRKLNVLGDGISKAAVEKLRLAFCLSPSLHELCGTDWKFTLPDKEVPPFQLLRALLQKNEREVSKYKYQLESIDEITSKNIWEIATETALPITVRQWLAQELPSTVTGDWSMDHEQKLLAEKEQREALIRERVDELMQEERRHWKQELQQAMKDRDSTVKSLEDEVEQLKQKLKDTEEQRDMYHRKMGALQRSSTQELKLADEQADPLWLESVMTGKKLDIPAAVTWLWALLEHVNRRWNKGKGGRMTKDEFKEISHLGRQLVQKSLQPTTRQEVIDCGGLIVLGQLCREKLWSSYFDTHGQQHQLATEMTVCHHLDKLVSEKTLLHLNKVTMDHNSKNLIGEGANGRLFAVRDIDDQALPTATTTGIAIKRTEMMSLHQVAREVLYPSVLTNNLLVPVLGAYTANQLVHLVSPLAKCDLGQFLEKNRSWLLLKEYEPVRILIALDVVQGLVQLHRHHAVHQDLKLANILVFPNPDTLVGFRCKLADYGEIRSHRPNLSAASSSASADRQTNLLSTARTNFGTHTHWSPQQWNAWRKDLGKHVKVHMEGDIFAIGHILHEIFHCKTAYSVLQRKVEAEMSYFEQLKKIEVEKFEAMARHADDHDSLAAAVLQAHKNTENVKMERFTLFKQAVEQQKLLESDHTSYNKANVSWYLFGYEVTTDISLPTAPLMPFAAQCPEELKQLIMWCWCYEPKDRPAILTIRECLIRMLGAVETLPLKPPPSITY